MMLHWKDFMCVLLTLKALDFGDQCIWLCRTDCYKVWRLKHKCRRVVWGRGWGSLELLPTCFIKAPKCEFLPTTTHCMSDLEIKDLPPSSLVGGLIFRWAVIENGRERRTMAVTFHYKGTACSSRASLQTTWKPLWSNIPEGLLRAVTLTRLPSHRNYLHEGRILERSSTAYKTNIWQKGEGEEGGGRNVTQIQKW